MPARVRRSPTGARSCARRSSWRPTICRSTSSRSSRHEVRDDAPPRRDRAAGRGHGAALYEATAEEAARFGLLRLRGVELCGAGQREPAQPHLLALRRLRRHRPRRAWQDHALAATHLGHAAPSCAGTVGRARRTRGARNRRAGAVAADGPRARDAADGVAALRGDRRRHGSPHVPAWHSRMRWTCRFCSRRWTQATLPGATRALVATPDGRLRLDALLAAILR